MSNATRFRALAGVAAVAAAFVACSESPTTSALVPGGPSLAATVRSAEVERVEVCKDYVMTTSATPPTANFTATTYGAFGLDDGECYDMLFPGGAGVDVTVTETAIPGYITTYKVTNLAGSVTGPTAGLSTTVHPAGSPAAGFLIEFINTEEVNTGGCTLTQGYWKTHNATFPGGAQADPTWAILPGGLAESTLFFLSGQTWYQVFWTAPAGNAYYNLAHQYMAAWLNVLAGADPTAVSSALAAATTLFSTYTPAQIGALSGNNALRKQFINLAGILGSYNEGTIGPGHCQDD